MTHTETHDLPTTRCCSPGTRRTACRRSPRCGPSTSSRRSTRRCASTAPRSTRSRAEPSRRPSTTRSPRSTAPAGCSTRVDGAVPQPDVERDLAGAAGGRARDGAAAGRARQRGLHARRRCSRASTRCTSGATRSASTPSSCACSSASTSTSCAPARRLGAGRAGALRAGHAAAGRADDALRPERARRRGELPARAARAKPTSPACPTSCAPRRARPRAERGIADAGVITLSRSHIVPFLTFSRAARPARAGLARLDRRAASTPARTTTAPVAARDPRAAPRAGARCTATRATPTTRSPTRWRGSAGGGDARCSTQVWAAGAARAPRREREALAGAGAVARRDAARSSPGTGATTPRRCARCATTLDEAEVKPYFPLERMVAAAFDCAAAPVRPALRRRGPTSPPTTPTSQVYEVRDADGALVGLFLHDNFARADQAQRRLDELVPRCSRATAAGDGRSLPIIVNNNNFAQGRAGRADAAELRRRAHAVPRVRPRPARPAVERHLRAPVGHQRAARLRRAAVAAVRALARASPRC